MHSMNEKSLVICKSYTQKDKFGRKYFNKFILEFENSIM